MDEKALGDGGHCGYCDVSVKSDNVGILLETMMAAYHGPQRGSIVNGVGSWVAW